MSSHPSKRHTQIDFRTLGGLKPHPKTRPSNRSMEQEDIPSDCIIPERDAVKVLVKKRARSPDGDTIDPTTGLKRFKLVEAVNHRVRAHEHIRTKHESPWTSYKKMYQLRLGVGDRDRVTVAQRKYYPYVVTVRSFSGPDINNKFRMFQQIQHENFVSALEFFRFEDSSYVIFEHMPLSLHYVAGNPCLDELQLAAILGQILNGLAYLATKGLEHGSLTCSNVLINPEGEVKIADQEYCRIRPLENAEARDIRALSFITMKLMQGDIRDDGAIGVYDLRRWPSDSDAVSFLSETTSATSVDELMKHPLLQLPWRKRMLRGLVFFASIFARIGYKYPPS